jgi:hypothetical protein
MPTQPGGSDSRSISQITQDEVDSMDEAELYGDCAEVLKLLDTRLKGNRV